MSRRHRRRPRLPAAVPAKEEEEETEDEAEKEKKMQEAADEGKIGKKKKPLVEPCFFQWSFEFVGFWEYGEVSLGNC